MAELRPDVPNGFKNVVELETEHISAYHDKSIKRYWRFYGILSIRSDVNIKESITKEAHAHI
jgi:hypothetical protein